MTTVLPSFLEEIQDDLAPSCSIDRCDQSAAWAVWATHTRRGCPGTILLCNRHKEDLLSQWPAFLASARKCAACHQSKSGNVSDHVRLIPL